MQNTTTTQETNSQNEICPIAIIDITENSDFSIYVASLTDYNDGTLHGKWIDCGQGSDHVWEQIRSILETSPTALKYAETAEEWAIHDYDFSGLKLDECEDIDTLCELAEAIEEHGEALAVYLNYTGDRDIGTFEDDFCGVYESELIYASEIADECMEIPENIKAYFDYEAFARDLFINDNYSLGVAGGVAVFRY